LRKQSAFCSRERIAAVLGTTLPKRKIPIFFALSLESQPAKTFANLGDLQLQEGDFVLKLTTSVLALLLCVVGILSAEQVALKNGDHLSGTIVSMDGKKLVLKTTYAGDVTIDWDAVDQFTSDQPLVVTKSNQQTLTGTVKNQGADYVVTTAQGQQTVQKSEVAVMRSPADQAAYEKSLHPGPLEGWAGGGNFGLALARGNSDTTNVALGFDATRKTTNDQWVIDAASIYTTDGSTGNTTANSFQGLVRYDHNLTKRVFVYGAFAGGYDELQNLNYRITPGGGFGFHAIATAKTSLDLLAGLGYTRESYTTGLIRNLFTATVGDEFAYKLGARTTVMQNLYYLPALNDTSNYRITGNFGIATKLNGWMTANLLFNDRYNSQPVLGNKNNDILFTTGLGFTFGAKAK
jgi:putative salt-induced outer membrane protein YdiY